MIRIETLNKNQLNSYINSSEFYEQEFIPISKHRAVSHINNPRASKDDILLILAYDDDKLAGYLGILPDFIFNGNKHQKIGWLSCIYVGQSHRGKRIAQKLVEKSLEVWDENILLSEFTAPAKRLYDKIGKFIELPPSTGIRLYLRSDLQRILAPKHIVFAKSKAILRLFDSVFNMVFDIRYLFAKKDLKGLKLEYISTIDREVIDLIEEKQKRQLFKRGIEELNWIIQNPWIISTKNTNCDKYHFSAIDNSFDFVSIKIRDDKKLVAFMIFAKRNDNLKVPYCYYEDIENVITVINYHLIKWKIKTASVYNSAIANKIKASYSPALFKKQIFRKYLISKKFKEIVKSKNNSIQDGDGDAAFT